MADVLTRLAAINTKLDRTLEAAPGWDNPRYTQIWNDIQHPTLLQADELPISPPPSLNITDFGGTNTQEEEGLRQKEVQRWQKEESGKHQQLADKEIQRKREEEETQRELGEAKRPGKRATREKADSQWRQQEQSRAEAGRNSMAEENRSAEWKRQVQQEREEQQRRPEQEVPNECEDADGGSREAAVDTCLDTNETVSPEMSPQPANLPRLAVPPRPHLKTIQTKVPPTPLQPTQNNAMLQATPWESGSHHLLPHDSPQSPSTSPSPSYLYQYPSTTRTPQKSPPPSPQEQTLQTSISSAIDAFCALPLLSSDLPHTKISISRPFIRPNYRGKEVLSFLVHVDPGRGKEGWKVKRMYKDVLDLDSRVRASVAKEVGKKIMVLPEGKLWRDHAPAKADQRKAVLESYFQTLIDLPVEINEEVIEFFTTDIVKETMQPVMQAGHKEGYLTKRGKNFGGWKTRFFILQGPVLEYYNWCGGTHLGSINVTGAQIGRQQCNPSFASADDEKEYRHAFLIDEAKKGPGGSHSRHVLCAESDEERDSWVELLARYFSGSYSFRGRLVCLNPPITAAQTPPTSVSRAVFGVTPLV
ncbi:Rho GTPase activating protein [Marasmius crinis-equi]|uniref:Rho GTPase activating protein n=1 Tax=Marasmius crinis-equi TaxID=585013 RepID=A0ABR3ES37_9AGAR